MVENDNISTAIGDVILFQTVPMLNMQTITSYSDSVTGEVGTTRYFERDFQYSLDGGVTWSIWYNLNGINASNITVINTLLATDYHQLVILFKFSRVGTDNTGELQINSISLNGTNVERASVFLVGGNSALQDVIYNNIDVLNLMINLAQKMYAEGIVPVYLTRGENEAFNSDAAYVDFWQTLAYFYAAITVQSLQFENVYWKRPVLCEFLRERNIFLCDCTDIIEMQLIAQNFLTEMRVRGTEEIFKPKGYQYNIGYRISYNMPVSYVIQPSTGVQIDGIAYPEVSALPFGWTVVGGDVLIAADRNTHTVLFVDGNGDYTVPPLSQGTVFPASNSGIFKQYNGEYLRLICYNVTCDEFIYNNVSDVFLGWCLANSSPCYQGLRPQRNMSILKAYEQQASVLDLTRYPLINASLIYIGSANNPYGVSDTVMYISSNGNPCLPSVPPIQVNVSTNLTLNVISTTTSVNGVVTLTNLTTSESFQIPIAISGGNNNFQIFTDLDAAQYSIELNFEHSGLMVSEVADGAGVDIFDYDTTGVIDIIYELNNVGSPNLIINLTFS